MSLHARETLKSDWLVETSFSLLSLAETSLLLANASEAVRVKLKLSLSCKLEQNSVYVSKTLPKTEAIEMMQVMLKNTKHEQ